MSQSAHVMCQRLTEVIAYCENLLADLADHDAPEAMRMKAFLQKDVEEKRHLLHTLREQQADWACMC